MRNEKTKKIVTLSLFSAIVVVLQIVATFINFGGFPITLTLVPIIVAGAIYNEIVGGFMGLVFGVVVSVMVVTGADPSGATMLAAHPIITIVACLLKGFLAGYLSALAYKLIKNKKVSIFVASAIAPIVNTLTLYVVLILFFESSFAALIAAFISINFVIELIINVAIAPGLLRIINMRRK